MDSGSLPLARVRNDDPPCCYFSSRSFFSFFCAHSSASPGASFFSMIAGHAPQHPVVVARELTKMFEEFQRGPAQSVLEHFTLKTPKGEITLLIAPAELPKWMTRSASADPS